jgi:hypothetical protein
MSVMPIAQISTSIQTLQSLAALSSRLSWRLYDNNDVLTFGKLHEVAREISLLSTVLRQLADKLEQAGKIASIQAFHDVIALSDQCQAAYDMIEKLESVKHAQIQDAPSAEGTDQLALTVIDRRQDIPPPLFDSEISFLRAFLNVISCNLGIMSQTLNAGQLIVRSRYEESNKIVWTALTCKSFQSPRASIQAIQTERMHLEGLIVNQQRSTIDATKLHVLYQEQRMLSLGSNGDSSADSTMLALLPRGLHSQDLQVLIPCNSRSLIASHFGSEVDSLSLVRRVSPDHVDQLLERWTTIHQRRRDSLLMDQSPILGLPEITAAERERRRSMHATVESDEETEVDGPAHRPGGSFDYSGPVLDSTDSKQQPTTSPIGIPQRNAGRSKDRHGPPLHWNPSFLSNSSAPTPHRLSSAQASPNAGKGPMPNFHRTTSLPASPSMTFTSGPHSLASTSSTTEDYLHDDLQIPYRLCMRDSCWDFVDEALVHTNTSIPPSAAYQNSGAVTEIREVWVHPEALLEKRLKYQRISRDVNAGTDSRRSKFKSFYVINRPLRFQEVAALVERSSQIHQEIVEEERKKSEEQPRRASLQRARTEADIPRRASNRRSSNVPVWAPRESDLAEAIEEYHISRNGSDKAQNPQNPQKPQRVLEPRRTSSARRRSESIHDDVKRRDISRNNRRGSERDHRDSDESSDGERSKERQPRKRRGSNALKIVAEGVGIATLLSGLL